MLRSVPGKYDRFMTLKYGMKYLQIALHDTLTQGVCGAHD
jgi:hypothetical protein